MPRYQYVFIGGGMLAGYAAKALAERGLGKDQLAIVSADDHLPYERPPLSKGFLAGQKEEVEILINDEQFYDQHGIRLYLRTQVTGVDLSAHRLTTDPDESIEFDKLIIGTGGRVRRLAVPGADLDGICYLRSMDDALRIRDRYQRASRAVVIGSGFIGMEVASVLAQKKKDVTMVFRDGRVWQSFFTPQMSAFFQQYYEERGVHLKPRSVVDHFRGEGHVESVVLESGEELPTDLVVAGVGIEPAVEIFKNTGLSLDNGIVVNEFLEASSPDVYAGGDVANYYDVIYGKQRRFEHWDNAVSQGEFLARLLTGERKPFLHVPYFFSDEFDISYELWGDPSQSDRVIYRGEVGSGHFSAWWISEGRVVAAFVLNRPDEERELAQEWIQKRIQIPLEALQDESRALSSLEV